MDKCKLTVENGGEIKVTELIDFLFLFNKIYSHYASLKEQELCELRSKIKAGKIDELRTNGVENPTPPGKYDEKYQFKIISMHYNSPLELVMYGISVALTMAVIFSGGEVKMGILKLKVNSLGTGIESMREAIKGKTHKQDKNQNKDPNPLTL